MKNKTVLIGLLVLAVWAFGPSLPGAELIRVSGDGLTLSERWVRAEKMAGETGTQRCYVGYSITRMMDEGRSCIIHGHLDDSASALTVAELLGDAVQKSKQLKPAGLARQVLNDKKVRPKSERKAQDMALLFVMERVNKDYQVRNVVTASFNARIHLESIPVYWLNRATNGESLDWLEQLFDENSKNSVLKELVAAIGLHDETNRVLPLLEKALAKKHPDDVREAAVFWLGEQESEGSVERLKRLWREEKDEDILEAVICALGRLELPSALENLIFIAKKETRPKLRRNAIFWLSQKAAAKACRALEEIATATDEKADIREHAVFALSQHEMGVDALIRLVHGNSSVRVRKKAIFWLGQCEDVRALDTILDILEK